MEQQQAIELDWRAARRRALFSSAVPIVFSHLTDLAGIMPSESRWLEVSARDEERLMRRWIAELLLIFETEGTLFSRAETDVIQRDGRLVLRGRLWGETLAPDRHVLKSVPLQIVGLSVDRQDGAWSASVAFDREPTAAGG